MRRMGGCLRAAQGAVDEKRCAVRPLVRQRDPVGGETGKPAALVTKRRVRAPPPKCVTGRPDSTRSRFPFSSRAAVPAVPESYRLPPGAAPLPAPSGTGIVVRPPHPPVQGQAGRKELCREAQRASGSPNWLLAGRSRFLCPWAAGSTVRGALWACSGWAPPVPRESCLPYRSGARVRSEVSMSSGP